ncbi:MAG TPA: hypothetical protein RMH99_09460 [Sandaracinaceae bacterium LLY-WYZ-13_1]|nr:hypothetical protein [Sandaracinaceae bacterium LLY-WYZ-13_1]
MLVWDGSSDAWSGTRRDVELTAAHPRRPHEEIRYRAHFLGSRILDAVTATLRAGEAPLTFTDAEDAEVTMPDRDDAETVLLAGASAASGGVRNQLDRFAEPLRATDHACAGGEGRPLDVRGVMDAALAPARERPVVMPNTVALGYTVPSRGGAPRRRGLARTDQRVAISVRVGHPRWARFAGTRAARGGTGLASTAHMSIPSNGDSDAPPRRSATRPMPAIRERRRMAFDVFAKEQVLSPSLRGLLQEVMEGARGAELAERLSIRPDDLAGMERIFHEWTGRSVYDVAIDLLRAASRLNGHRRSGTGGD